MSERTVGVIGVGRLGADIAFALAERDLCDIVLYDTDHRKAAQLAADLSDTSFGHVYNRRVSWVEHARELTQCGVVVVAAGARRDTTVTGGELFARNHAIVREVAETFVGTSTLFVVASEPVDLMTAALSRALNLQRSGRVIGIGGLLDAIRVRHAVAERTGFSPEYIRANVIGPYDSEAMILWDFSSVNGVPIRSVVATEVLESVDSAFVSDSEMRVRRMNDSLSRFTPAIACVELLRAVVKDDRRVLSVTAPWVDTLGISGVAMSIPCVVGSFGAERFVIPPLADEARERLRWSARRLAAAAAGVVS